MLDNLSHPASQEISPILWNLKVHYRVHKSPNLNQMKQVHTFPHNFSKMNCIIILTCTPSSSKWSLTFRFSDKKLLRISLPCVLHASSSLSSSFD